MDATKFVGDRIYSIEKKIERMEELATEYKPGSTMIAKTEARKQKLQEELLTFKEIKRSLERGR